MALSINQNITAVNAYRNLSNTQNDLSKSLERLSSGLRINRAADDAAGLAISEGLRSQVGGLKVAARNAQDGISVVQTAEGALTEVHSVLQRLRDLGVQAGNDSNNDKARANIATEAKSLVDELGRIAKSTNFNGQSLLNLNGADAKLNFQVGADGNTDSRIQIDLANANVANVESALTVRTYDATKDVAATKAIATYAGVDESAAAKAAASAFGVDPTSITTASGLASALATASGGSNTGATASFDAGTLTVTAGGTEGAASVLKAADGSTVATGTAAGKGAWLEPASGESAFELDFSSHATAQASVNAIDAQIESISTARANLGAYQNRFEHTISNINVAVENLSASESRIRDTDMANEMVAFTRANILSQAGTAMLAQANQIPQGVLSLLR